MEKLIASELASDLFGAGKVRDLDGITARPGFHPAWADDARGTVQECLLGEANGRGRKSGQIPEQGPGLGGLRREDDAFGSGAQAIERW